MDMETKNAEKSDNESLGANASILDFRSPTIKAVEEKRLFNFKSAKYKKNKQAQLKINVKINSTDNKPGTSKQAKENISEDAHMQIESNVLCEQENKPINLPNDTKVAYVCPLCFKNFRDSNSRILHMKSCATKNKVSMKKLLQAMKLQERQTAERISLGLPGAPILPNKKQASICKMSINEDSQLQLALALSKSLYEVEESKNNSDIEQNFIVANTLTSGGNITGRLQKRKKHKFISVLQIRSQEERDRLLSEKIAEILIDNETLTQRQQQLNNENENIKKHNLRSHILKKLLNFDNKLWNTAMLQSSQEDFYVTALSPYIIPSEQKPAFMENINNVNIINKSHQEDPFAIKHDLYRHKKDSSSISHKTDVELSLDVKKENLKRSSVNTLVVDWRNALNNSSSSDVVIFVNGDRHIWVHKLVFYVRCPNILLDIIPNENTVYSVKERICWTDIEYYIALAFLEFIYCGIIEKYSISSSNTVAISSLGNLARRYRMKELFRYLRHEYVNIPEETSRYQKFETNEQDMQEICYSNDKKDELVLTHVNYGNVVKCSNQDTFDVTTTEVSHDILLKTNISLEKCTIPDSPIDRQKCMSPDIFDDIDNTALNQTNNTKFKNMENSKNYIEYDLSSPNQNDLENIIPNAQLSSSLSNKSQSSRDECILNKSIIITPKINQIKQVADTTDKVKQKSDFTLFIEEIQKENAKSDFEVCSEENSPPMSCFQHDFNPFKKAEYDESNTVFKTLYSSKFSQTKAKRKVGRLSKLESDMQIHAIENPQLYNITINDDFNLSTPANHDYTKLSSPIREVDVSTACCYDKKSEKIIQSVHKNDISITTSHCSSSEIDTDDADISMYTKYKRKHTDNSIALYRSALKKHRNMDESISIIRIEKNMSNLSSSQTSINEMEICNTLMNNTSENTESFKQPKTNNCSNEISAAFASDICNATCDNNGVKIQISNNESSNDDSSNILNFHSTELPDIKTQYNSPVKSPIDSNVILVSSSPEIDINSIDNDYFSKNEYQWIRNSKNQLFDDNVPQSFFKTNFSNSNIKNRIESITSYRSTQPISTKNKRVRKRSKSEGSLQLNCNIEKDDQVYEFNNALLRHCNKQDNYKSNMKNRFLTITETNDISPPNYDVMDTPKLHKEMKKYGLKIQNRNKAIKLLTYIYDEMHPTINSYETLGTSAENIYNEDEEPQRKKQKINTNLLNKYNNIEYECSTSPLRILNSNDFETTEMISEANVNVENLISLNDCININEAFSKLINSNKDLHNKILQYEPLNIELIHCMLKVGGFKCKVNTLMDFLDEQCITFYLPENKTKSRTRKVHN